MPGEIIPWLFEGEHLVRSTERESEPWFVGIDVCKILELAKPHQALERLDADERGTCIIGTPGGPQEVVVISEPGVFRLVFPSRKPVAERLKRWLAHDVLPAIRRTGRFETQQSQLEPVRPFPDWPLEEMRTKGSTVDRYRLTYGIAAARWIMPKIGFPEPPADLVDPLPPRQYAFEYPAAPPGGH